MQAPVFLLALAASNSTEHHSPTTTELYDVVWWVSFSLILLSCAAVALPGAYYPVRYVTRVYREPASGVPVVKGAPVEDERPLLPGERERPRPASPSGA
jgi:hypothetical protein